MNGYEEVVKQAFLALENAYAPYSHFYVGACVETFDHQFFKGCNVENASYGLTNCAERNAVFAAYSNGYRKDDIKALAIVSNSYRITTPCGACRQVLWELLNNDTPIILSNKKEERVTTIHELLPDSFDSEDLK